MLLGGVVATPTELTLSGTLLRVSDGAVVANGSVAGTPDSVAVLVNRLTARLLSLEAGEERERLDGLAATSLEALQDYLAGQKAYRRGEYDTAMDLYGRALGRDSNFAQAVFGLVKTNPLIGTVSRVEGLGAIPTVWRLRERLSTRDVALLRSMAFVGPNYPGPSSHAEIIAQAERAAAGAPDSPEQWLQLGYGLAQYGAVASIPDWPRRAAEALDRAVALDSGFAPAVQARLFLTTRASDPVTTRRLMAAMEAPVRAGLRGRDDAVVGRRAAGRQRGGPSLALAGRRLHGHHLLPSRGEAVAAQRAGRPPAGGRPLGQRDPSATMVPPIGSATRRGSGNGPSRSPRGGSSRSRRWTGEARHGTWLTSRPRAWSSRRTARRPWP